MNDIKSTDDRNSKSILSEEYTSTSTSKRKNTNMWKLEKFLYEACGFVDNWVHSAVL